ncbi:MAG: efflux RND transporter periplasmic adaptor subunit [Bacteroidetes bacterium]|nr:efflux RND transporter periplasmic adaptor subunit [Bacteroidota bacterium]
MKNRFTYLAVFAALLIGFTIAWFIKPIQHQNIAASQHQTKDQDYTCSMHPQIRQNEPGLCPICEMDLILVGENASDDPLVLEMTKEAVKLSNIQTTTIGESGKVEKVISLTGKIKTDERLTASQVAHIPGRIEQLFVTFTGDRVKKGQKLATIYSPELLAAQGELLEAAKFQDVNNSLLEAARNKLRYWKIPDAIIEEIEKSGKIKETFLLYAEAEGYVTNRRVSVGDYVRQGQVLSILST